MVAAIGVGLASGPSILPWNTRRSASSFGQRICDRPRRAGTLGGHVETGELADLALMQAAVKVQEHAGDRGVTPSLAKKCRRAKRRFSAPRKGSTCTAVYGFMSEYEISKLARDAHIIDIYEGVREVQDMIIGRELV